MAKKGAFGAKLTPFVDAAAARLTRTVAARNRCLLSFASQRGLVLSLLKRCLVSLSFLTIAAPAFAQTANNCPEGKGCGWKYEAAVGTVCRLGAQSGVAVRKASNPSDTLFITMQGGGACTNAVTCVGGAYSFDQDDFDKATDPTDTSAVTHLMAGIWNRQDPSSQVARFHHVYIPYCSGDLHAGDAEGYPTWPYKSQFKGWQNSKKYFELIAGKVVRELELAQPGTPIRRVVLSGISAGGYGAVLNLPQLQRALVAAGRPVEVVLVNDSAPFFDNVDSTGANGGTKLWSRCLQKGLYDRFGFANTFMKECASCTATAWLAPWQSTVLTTNPKVHYAFVSSTDDLVIRAFLTPEAFSECQGQVPETHEPQYLAGLEEIRTLLKSPAVATATRRTATYFESYNGFDDLLGSIKHVFLHNGTPAQATGKASGYFYPYVANTSVKSWLESFLNNQSGSAASRHVGTCTPAALGTFNCN